MPKPSSIAGAPTVAAEHFARSLADGERCRVLGAQGALRGYCLARAALAADTGAPIVYVAPDDAAASTIACDTAFFLGAAATHDSEVDGPILVMPEFDVSPYADVSPDPRAVAARLAALARLLEPPGSQPKIIIVTARSLLRKVIPRASFAALCRTWTVEQELVRDEAIELLLAAGYLRTDVVEDPGTFAVRGGLMDVFVPRMRYPVRIEWFGDDIERMRLFDAESQRSLRTIETCRVHPVRETITTTRDSLRARVLAVADAANVPTSRSRQVIENLESGLDFFGIEGLTPIFHDTLLPLSDYLPQKTAWVVDEPDALMELTERISAELEGEYTRALGNKALVCPPASFSLSEGEFKAALESATATMHRLDVLDAERGRDRSVIRIETERSPKLAADLKAARERKGGEVLRPLVEHIRALNEEDPRPWGVVVAAPNLTHAERLTSLLRGYGLSLDAPRSAEDKPLVAEGPQEGPTRVRVIAGDVSTGFESTYDRFLLLSEGELFGTVTRRAKRSRRRTGIGNLAQLAVGDYIVHVTHGVGRYSGLTKLSLGGIPGDFVLIEYAGNDKLYLPVYRLGEIERYVSAEAKPPRLDRMGGSTFATKTDKVKAEVRQIAEELLQIYAQREALEGHSYPDGGEVFEAFEATFPFEETPDQQDAIDATQGDLGRPQPMDRLVCGDVGFGKTEVALRAAFRAAIGGKQVAVLAPTTVLVQQHYHTFRERMESFGVRVERLNRLVDTKASKEIITGIREGTVDVIVGTHRLLSRDVRFKELGLVIIDEEQRFGVTQKERFKKLKTQVDVLTLSATPIPRTLHLSLLGVREISLIMTPPVDRLAVRTFLTRPSDVVIEEGIRKELARGGQIFYVVPKIQGIEEHAVRIRELVPEARVIVAHGQMPAEMLEQTMVDFVEHAADVLVCTTIIESGLDIPRANTMFVERAEMFGLSQLYQLRGRIGRSKHRAFCYLMVNSLEKLAPEARRRLEAIQRFSELGSGFQVASEDLEIRGAGEILGARQSGQIHAIGFEAYSRILAEAVAELRGQPIASETDPEMVFDVPAFLPDSYVEDTGQRLDLYRRLSSADSVDAVHAVMEEVKDRFGELPSEAVALGYVMACKTYGRKLHAQSLEMRGAKLTVRLSAETPLPAEAAASLHGKTKGRVRLAGSDRIVAELQEANDRQRLASAQNALAELFMLTQEKAPASAAGGRRR